MNSRVRTLWFPSFLTLAGSMLLRLFLQNGVRPTQTLLNHAVFPLMSELLWLGFLPLFGAMSAYSSRRSGGSRSIACIAAVFPTIIMMPLWFAMAINMKYPSPAQWFGLLSGVANWIVLPALALLAGALPFLKANRTVDWRACLSTRTSIFLLPSLVSLTTAMAALTLSTVLAVQAQVEARGFSTFVAYIPWVLVLPLCSAAGAKLSRRAGGGPRARIAVGLFPVSAITALVALLVATDRFVFANPHAFYFSTSLIFGVMLPCVALLIGALPFAKAPKAQA
jgi:hypothetical protein